MSKKSSCIQYWNVNNFYGWAMPQKRPVINFERTLETSKFNEDFLKTITRILW